MSAAPIVIPDVMIKNLKLPYNSWQSPMAIMIFIYLRCQKEDKIEEFWGVLAKVEIDDLVRCFEMFLLIKSKSLTAADYYMRLEGIYEEAQQSERDRLARVLGDGGRYCDFSQNRSASLGDYPGDDILKQLGLRNDNFNPAWDQIMALAGELKPAHSISTIVLQYAADQKHIANTADAGVNPLLQHVPHSPDQALALLFQYNSLIKEYANKLIDEHSSSPPDLSMLLPYMLAYLKLKKGLKEHKQLILPGPKVEFHHSLFLNLQHSSKTTVTKVATQFKALLTNPEVYDVGIFSLEAQLGMLRWCVYDVRSDGSNDADMDDQIEKIIDRLSLLRGHITKEDKVALAITRLYCATKKSQEESTQSKDSKGDVSCFSSKVFEACFSGFPSKDTVGLLKSQVMDLLCGSYNKDDDTCDDVCFYPLIFNSDQLKKIRALAVVRPSIKPLEFHHQVMRLRLTIGQLSASEIELNLDHVVKKPGMAGPPQISFRDYLLNKGH